MFTKAESEFLLRRLQRNEVVLFVGAGFAAEATNHKNEKLPIGKQLAEKIWNFISTGIVCLICTSSWYKKKKYSVDSFPCYVFIIHGYLAVDHHSNNINSR